MKQFLWIFFAGILLIACQKESKLPVAPEAVVKKFQKYIDNNQFEEAKLLSTPRGKERLDDLAEIIRYELEDSTIFSTTFLSVNCSITADTAICICNVKDKYEEEAYETEYKLVKINGQWLVDVPEEEKIEEEEFIEEMLDSLDFDSLFIENGSDQ